MKHLVIPDVQAKPGVPLDHLIWIGKYILLKKPEVIICLGDFADMESLSSYDKGKKSFEGRRYKEDINSARTAMSNLLTPINEYNKKMAMGRHKQYKPRMVLTLGNHEQRIERVTECQPEFDGVIHYNDLPYNEWEVYDFLEPVEIDGITYVHYLANPMTGKPYSGTAANQMLKARKSFIVGHKQVLDVHTSFSLDGRQQWGIIAGSAYLHDELYKGPQGNNHWRGIIMLHNVVDGSFDPMFISLNYLKNRFVAS
jgi:hypothetical protein